MIDAADFKKWLQIFNVPSGGGGGGGVSKLEVQSFAFNYSAATGVNDAFIVTLDPPVEALVDNLIISMSSGALENDTTSPTLQVDSLPAKPIQLWSGFLTPGDISINSSYLFIYNEEGDFFELINPSISAANSFLVQENAYNSAVDAGAADAYSITLLVPPQGSFGVGFPIYMQVGAGNTNTGASTLTVNGETDNIVLNNGSALPAGALVENQIYYFLYSGGNWVVMNPSNVVTIDGAQTVTGAKFFEQPVQSGSAATNITVGMISTNPTVSADGSSTNINLNFQAKGTGTYSFNATSTRETRVNLFEQTTNGSNLITISPPAAVTTSYKITLPNAPPTVNNSVLVGTTAATMQWSPWEENQSWTPVLVGSTVAGSPTGVFGGRYIRQGAMVQVSGQIALINLGGLEGNVQIQGLPYPITSATVCRGGISVGFHGNMTNSFVVGGWGVHNTARIDLVNRELNLTYVTHSDISNAFNLYFTFVYQTSA